MYFFFFNDTATTEIYTYCHTLSLHDALPSSASASGTCPSASAARCSPYATIERYGAASSPAAGISPRTWSARSSASRWPPSSDWILRSEEHTSELQSLMRISYAVFCLKKKKHYTIQTQTDKNKT